MLLIFETDFRADNVVLATSSFCFKKCFSENLQEMHSLIYCISKLVCMSVLKFNLKQFDI